MTTGTNTVLVTTPTRNAAKSGGVSNNTWFCCPAEANTVFIFIHGVLSDSEKCWTSKSGAFWPQLISSDLIFEKPAIFMGGYHTSINSGDFDIAQCSRELHEALTHRHNEYGAPLEYENIVFLCHSLGGIVARRLLETHYQEFEKKVVGLVLLASPTLGSSYASILAPIIRLYKNSIGKQLNPKNSELLDLDDRFKEMVHKRKIPNLYGAEAIEQNSIIFSPKYFPNIFGRVVSADSASRYFGGKRILPGTDHSTIVKPESTNHVSHKFLVNFFTQQFKPNVKLSVQLREGGNAEAYKFSKSPLVSSVLFDIYSKDVSEYYLDRQSDITLKELTEIYSVWIYGPSGSGKTSLARRYAEQIGYSPIEISLSNSVGPQAVQIGISEIYESFSQKGLAERLAQPANQADAIGIVAKHAGINPIPLIVDEVPINDEGGTPDQLLKFVLDLLEGAKRTAGPHVRFLVCSIHAPRFAGQPARAQEKIQLLELRHWSTPEMTALARLIRGSSLPIKVQDHEIPQLIQAACGSPRSLKDILRFHYIKSKNSEQGSLIETIAEYKETRLI